MRERDGGFARRATIGGRCGRGATCTPYRHQRRADETTLPLPVLRRRGASSCFVELANPGGCRPIEWYSCREPVTRSHRGVNRSRRGDRASPLKENAVMPLPSADESVELDQPCPIRDVLDRIGDQWSLLVLEALAGGTIRFNELGRTIGDVSNQMLSRTLKRLEHDGFVSRTLFAEVPPRVEYALTDLGRSFLTPMQAMIRWADEHHRAICAARRRAREQEGGGC
jgi:DNA-binding HxlR family transcriptional regulator